MTGILDQPNHFLKARETKPRGEQGFNEEDALETMVAQDLHGHGKGIIPLIGMTVDVLLKGRGEFPVEVIPPATPDFRVDGKEYLKHGDPLLFRERG